MIIIQIGIGSFGTATGVTTTNKAINVATVNGRIGVNQPVSAGSSTVSIAAGSAAGQDKALALNQSVTGNGGVTLTGDNMNLTNGSAAVNAGTAVAILRPSDPATLIDVGGADAAGTLGLTDAELDKVTAGVLRVGDVTDTAGLNVTAAISQGPYTALSLVNGGNVLEPG